MSDFSIPVIERKKRPQMGNTVSSLFATSKKREEEEKKKQEEMIAKQNAQKFIQKERKALANPDKEIESPFLAMLKQRKQNPTKTKIVPTPDPNKSSEPIDNFGEKLLMKQGWQKGDPIGS